MARAQHRTIQPHQPISEWASQLWQRRETLLFFVWRDLKVQYSTHVLGLLWSVFQPLFYFGIIILVMNFAGRSGSIDELPFQVYLISGLAIWNFVTTSITGAISGIQSNAGIITKAAFPRFYIVLTPIVKSTIDFSIVLLIVFALAFWNGLSVSLSAVIWLPLTVFCLVGTTIGIASLVTSLVVLNRHVRHLIPVVLYAGLFLLPVFYSTSQTGLIGLVNTINPIAGSMTLLRHCFVENIVPFQSILNWSMLSLGLTLLGMLAFKKVETTLADRI